MNRNIKFYIGKLYLLSIWLFCIKIFAQAPDLKFEHFTDDNGLSQSSVMKILQDNEGYLWMATPNGLYKYDGKTYRIFRHESNNSNSLINNSVFELELDASGNILIGTGRGLSKFDKVTETFSSFPKVLSNKRISAIYPEKDGSLWVGTLHSGLYYFKKNDKIGNQPIHYVHQSNQPSSISSNQIHSITKDNEGNLWVGTVNGLNKMPQKSSSNFIRFKTLNQSVKSLFLDPKNRLWVGLEGLLLICIEDPDNFNSKEQTNFKQFDFNIKLTGKVEYGGLITINLAADDNLWLGIHGVGLYWFNTKTGAYKLYAPSVLNNQSLSSKNIETILVDRFKVLWVGTEEGGLNKCDLKKKEISSYTKNPLSKNSLSNPSVNAIIKDENNTVWVGTENGLNHIHFNKENIEQPKFKHYYPDNEWAHSEQVVQKPIWSILKDSDNDYWISSTDGITHMKFDHKTKKASFKQTKFNEMIEVFSSMQDSEGTLWFGSFINGLIKWKKKRLPNSNVFDFSNATYYLPNKNDKHSISGSEISCIFEDRSGHIWVGTLHGGLNLLIPGKNGQSDTFISYQHDPKNANTLSNNSVFSIHEDKKGNYWIGTFGGGLNKMTFPKVFGKSPHFEHFTEKEGLANDAIYGILEDENEKLWISTDNGISCFNPTTKKFTTINKEDGLLSNNFRKNAYFKNDNGYLFFGGLKGLNVFHPDNLKHNLIPAIPKITAFKIKNEAVNIGQKFNDRIILNQSLSVTDNDDKVVLKHNENVLTFEFTALHFAAPEKNNYLYKLEGFDEDWKNSKKTSFAHYTNLSPGDYVFKVKASNNDGIWNEKYASLSFSITPPFWLTIWAYLVYFIVSIAIFLALRSYFRLKAKERTTIKVQHEIEKANKLKLQFFTNISHDFKTPIAIIINVLEEVLDSFDISNSIYRKVGVMQKNAEYLLRLVNQLMEFRKIEVGETKLEATKSNVIHFVKQITFSFKALASKKNINLSFVSELNISEVWFDWDKLEKVLNNLISNAIKFTHPKGKVTVRIYKPKDNSTIDIKERKVKSEYICIEIKDDGTGIPHDQLPHIFKRFYQVNKTDHTISKSGSGIGLAITKDLVDLHHGSIEVVSKVNLGTCFTLKLPATKAHLLPEEITTFSEPKKQVIREVSTIPTNKTEKVKKSGNLKEKTVLVIDDNEDIRTLVKNILKDKYRILEADTGKRGLQIVLQELPELIISDVLMPEMDGIEFCHQLKSNIRTKHIPIILLTALNSVEHRIKGIESGADAYIPKPFKMKLLLITCKKLIESREAMRIGFQIEHQLTPQKIILDSEDKKFLDKIMELMETHMGNENYWIEQLVSDMNTSRSTFSRKLKKLTGQSPNDFIQSIRLKRAVQLLEQEELSIAEVSYKVGFNDPNYFGKCFRKQFGEAPSRYLSKIGA
ncbi:two-component regulator propeller domain-containing protein [Aquimarina agarilytica]|uniref:two-component regulator propeller domain-containing protein n=1 Tax=Aquimarina agarilytica TaxID=1087449 RepID=UPI001E4D9B04|nr:two-component regulator propeller domain-containing protein [Aquimarina agarilytica]